MFMAAEVDEARLCFFSSLGPDGRPATAESTFVSGADMMMDGWY